MKHLLFAFLFCLLPGWLYAQDSVTIHMDPDNTLGGNVSQLFDTVEYVPLETTKESLFGRIDKVISTDNFYFIFDISTDQILLFRKNGKFYSRLQMQRYIKSDGNGGIKNFMVDTLNKRIILNHYSISSQGTLYYFNFQGKLIKTEKIIHWENFAPLGNAHYLMLTIGDVKDSISGERGNCVITDSSIKVYNKFVLRALPDAAFGAGVYIHTIAGTDHCMYSRLYDYHVFEIAPQGIIKKYKFIFPLKYTLPSNFLDSFVFKKQVDYLTKENRQAIQGIDNLLPCGNFLSFGLKSTGGNNYTSHIFSIQSKNIYTLWNVSTDSAHYFLPCFYTYGKLSGSDENYFYSSIPVNYFKSAYEENAKERKIIYPDKLKQLYNSLKTNDNPILVRLKPKSAI